MAAAVTALQLGGNAIDAAVAAGFASSVVEPGLTSLAGGGFAVIGGSAPVRALDFFTTVPGLAASEPPARPATVTVTYPSAVQDFRVGPASAAVPGILDGYLELQRAGGRLPVAEVVAPAGFWKSGIT